MLKIYLSGAISNKDINVAKKEFAEAEKQLNIILKKFDFENLQIYNPFKILKINKKYRLSDCLKECIKILCDCNILINIKNEGWGKSKGAKLERKISKVLLIDIFTINKFKTYIYRYDFKRYMLDFFKEKEVDI